LEAQDREDRFRHYPQRQGAFHRHRLPVQVGRHMPGVGQRNLAIFGNAEREASGLGIAAP